MTVAIPEMLFTIADDPDPEARRQAWSQLHEVGVTFLVPDFYRSNYPREIERYHTPVSIFLCMNEDLSHNENVLSLIDTLYYCPCFLRYVGEDHYLAFSHRGFEEHYTLRYISGEAGNNEGSRKQEILDRLREQKVGFRSLGTYEDMETIHLTDTDFIEKIRIEIPQFYTTDKDKRLSDLIIEIERLFDRRYRIAYLDSYPHFVDKYKLVRKGILNYSYTLRDTLNRPPIMVPAWKIHLFAYLMIAAILAYILYYE